MSANPANDFVAQLCPNCGLCCNGVLFADVQLQKEDDIRRLVELGVVVKSKARRPAFLQPCACFDGKLCRIHAERPKQCRAFECGLLRRVQAGEMDADDARQRIAGARRRVETVLELLRRLGDRNETLALTKRYARVMRQAIDLAGPAKAAAGRGELMLAVDNLMHVLHQDFLK